MARFQVSSPTIKDKETEVEVRKLGTELTAKLNILAQNFKAYADAIAISFTTQSLTATVATIGTLTVTTLNGYRPWVISVNANTISRDFSFLTGDSGLSQGPVTVGIGVTVFVPSGSTWGVLL